MGINSENKQVAFNIVAQLTAFVVNFAINFLLTPFIIERVGSEAYGFVSLGNNFVDYASLAAVALNSMAGRFITIKIHQKDFDSARKYYSSVIIANIVISLVLSVPAALLLIFITKVVRINASLVGDIRLLWLFLFFHLIIGLISAVSVAGLFASNRIDIQSKRNIEALFLKAAILSLLFLLLPTHVWYIGFATAIGTLFYALRTLQASHQFYPQLRLSRKDFSIPHIRELLHSGVWNVVSRVGSIALTELDLLMTNWLVGEAAMGTLAIAKFVPNRVVAMIGYIVAVFLPQLTILYAKNDKSHFLAVARSNMRILLFFDIILYGILYAYADVFFALWLPEGAEDIQQLYILSCITIIGCLISAVIQVIFNIFTVTDKLKFSSLSVVGTGLASIVMTILLVKTTSLGIYAIAGVSVALCMLRNIFIIVPYGAKCVGLPWYGFYPDLLRNIISVAGSICVSLGMKRILAFPITWAGFFCSCIITGCVLLILDYFIVLRKEERKLLCNKIAFWRRGRDRN